MWALPLTVCNNYVVYVTQVQCYSGASLHSCPIDIHTGKPLYVLTDFWFVCFVLLFWPRPTLTPTSVVTSFFYIKSLLSICLLLSYWWLSNFLGSWGRRSLYTLVMLSMLRNNDTNCFIYFLSILSHTAGSFVHHKSHTVCISILLLSVFLSLRHYASFLFYVSRIEW